MMNMHQSAAERIVNNALQVYSVTKRYLSSYPLDQFYEKPQAKDSIIQTLNNGVSWAFFFGHGNEQLLTDEHVLTAESIDRLANDSMPFVLLAFTGRNGSFFASTSSSMCMKYLFTPDQGAIAYIASACATSATDNERLGTSFFSQLKKDPAGSLGELWTRTKSEPYASIIEATYYLLGDPALRVSTGVLPIATKPINDSIPSRIQLSLPGYSSVNYSISFTVRDSVRAAPTPITVSDLSFSHDSVVSTISGAFRDSVAVSLPQGLTVPIKAIVYVWNDTADGRAELLFSQGSTNPVSWMPLRRVAPAKPTLRKNRNTLFISGLEAGVNRIRIFDVLGRNIYTGEIRAGAGIVSIDLAGKKLRAGRYILQVTSRASETVLPFVHMAGE
jgi:hypothetical protein